MSPLVGTIRSTLARDQRRRWRSIPVTGSCLESPSSLRSNIAALPTRTTNPRMWRISTIG